MNACIIQNWNRCVARNDEVYILGDFLVDANGTAANRILNELNGTKYLVRRNHDKYLEDSTFDINNFRCGGALLAPLALPYRKRLRWISLSNVTFTRYVRVHI
jgi:predicted phosphohydrolase